MKRILFALGLAIVAFALGAASIAARAATKPLAVAVEAADPHANHHMAMRASQRSLAAYKVPALSLIRDDGKVVSLDTEIDDGRPVVLTFIYTSCTTVCPLVSHVLADLQNKLGPARDQVHIMSLSIDPEYDTPARLHAYAERYGAGPEWRHYTGSVAASEAAQRAFALYRGDKMNHAPATLVRPMPGAQWVRIEGFASADEILAELPSYCTASR